MAFYAFYVIAIIVLILHFTGWLKRNNLEWLVLAVSRSRIPGSDLPALTCHRPGVISPTD